MSNVPPKSDTKMELTPGEEEGVKHALEQAERGEGIPLDQGFDDVLEEIRAIGQLREARKQRTGTG